MKLSLPVINQHYISYQDKAPIQARASNVIELPNGDHSEVVNLQSLCDDGASQYLWQSMMLYKQNSIPLGQEPTLENETKGFLPDVFGDDLDTATENMIKFERHTGSQFPFIVALNKSGELIGCRLPSMPLSFHKMVISMLESQESDEPLAKRFKDLIAENEPTSTAAMTDKLLQKCKFPVKNGITPDLDNIWTAGGACISENYRGNGIVNQLLKLQAKLIRERDCAYLVNGHDIANRPSSRAMDKMGYSKEYLTDLDFRTKFKGREYALRVLDLPVL